MGGSSRVVVAKPSAQKGKSQELTTDLDHSNCLLHCFSLKVLNWSSAERQGEE